MSEDNDKKKLEVFFSESYTTDELPKSGWILVVPQKDTWNDFGHQCRCSFYVRQKSEFYVRQKSETEEYEDTLLLGFLPAQKNQASPYNKKTPSEFSFPELCNRDNLPEFFTLLPSMESYRRLIEKFNVDGPQDVLSALHDLVFLRKTSSNQELVQKATKTEVFTYAFMRNQETFYAYHNAEGILDGLDKENVKLVSQDYSLAVSLLGSDVDNRFKLHFDLESILPKRINVLIGRNGLGKSRSLNSIAESLIEDDRKFSTIEGDRVMINRLLALETPGETQNTFPSEPEKSSIQYRRLTLSRTGQKVNSRGFGELCVQLARSSGSIAGKTRWEILSDCLKAIKDYERIVLKLDSTKIAAYSYSIFVKPYRYVPLYKLSTGGEQASLELWSAVENNAGAYRYVGNKIVPLSSGEQAFLKFAVQACLFIENGTMVLLDEPETHLHPNLISDFVELLDTLLESTGSVAIVATHSAYFVREVPKSQVLVFKELEDETVQVVNPRLNTFGADVGAISYFVFEDDITSVLVNKLEKRFETKRDLDIYLESEEAKDLSADIVMHLKGNFGGEVEKD